MHRKIHLFFALSGKYLRLYLGISIIVFLFVVFFQPFDPELPEFEKNLLFFAGMGLITLVFFFLMQILFQRFLTQNEHNTFENSLVSSLFYFSLVAGTSLAFVFYLKYAGRIQISISIIIRAVAIGIGIASAVSINKTIATAKNRYKKLRVETRNIRDRLKQFSETYGNRYIELISENNSDQFRIPVSEIVFIKSAENYVEVGYYEGDTVKKKLIRNTLKNIEIQLGEFNNFIRTHRTSIVNIRNIEKLHKNFNTYWLSLVNSSETIPVSRQYLMAVKDLF